MLEYTHMFDNLKQLAKLKELRDSLEKERKEVEREGVRIVVNGKMEVEEIKLNPDLDVVKQEMIVKDCINRAFKEIQQEAAKKMFQM